MKIAWLIPAMALLPACTGTSSSTPTPARIHSQEPRAYQQLAITSDLSPSPLNGAPLVYFPPLAEVVLFGGIDENGHAYGNTWAFDQHGWRELHPATAPPARAQFAMAYDPALREIVLYGGCTVCGSPGFHLVQDTWAFNGTTWRQLSSLHLPTYEPIPLLSWDAATGALVLLAPPPGYGANPPNGDFNSSGGALGRWSWRTAGWTWDGLAPGPPLMVQGASFVPEPGSSTMLYYSYQPYSGSCVGVGPERCGYDPTGLLYSQTWTWDGRAFTRATPTVAPGLAAVVSDPRVGSVVALTRARIWIWSGTMWRLIAANVPPAAIGGAAEYDPDLGDVIVLGAATGPNPQSVTLLWDGSTWTTAAAN